MFRIIGKSKYLKKLIIFSLVLGILPMFFLGSFTYYLSSNMLQEKIEEANLQGLSQTRMRVEEVLNFIQSYYIIQANASVLPSFIDREIDFRDYLEIKEVQKVLSDVQNVRNEIKNAYFVNLKKDWIISTVGISDVKSVFEVEILRKQIYASRNAVWFYNRESENIFKNADTIEYNWDNLALIVKVPYNMGLPDCVIVVDLYQYGFEKSVAYGSETNEMLILNSNLDVLIRDGQTVIKSDEQMNDLINSLSNHTNNSESYTLEIQGTKYGVNYIRGNNEWVYASIYSFEEILAESGKIGVFTAFGSIIILIIIIIISFWGTRIIYNPIRKAYDIIAPGLSEDKMDNADELAVIGQGISHLMKNQNQMKRKIDRQTLHLEEYFVIRLLNDELDCSLINRNAKAYGYDQLWFMMNVLNIQVDSFEGSEFTDMDLDLVLLSIHNIVSEMIPTTMRMQPAISSGHVMMVLGSADEDVEVFRNYIYAQAREIQYMVKELLGVIVSMGIGTEFKRLRKANNAYRQSREVLQSKVLFGDKVILFYDDVQPLGHDFKSYPVKTEALLIEAITKLDEREAVRWIEKLIDITVTENYSVSEYRLFVSRLFICLISMLHDSSNQACSIFREQHIYLQELYGLRSHKVVKKWFVEKVIHPTIQVLDERRQNQYEHILDNVFKIIHEEYDTDLSIENVAERLSYHPSYIWRVLKKEGDTSFTDYLMQYRLKMAKELLETTNMPIREIAEKLRYNNSQNFIRYFKKLEGLTPGRYREQHLK